MTTENEPDERVFAIVVTFYPVRETLDTLVAALTPQVERVVVIDNTPSIEGGAVRMMLECAAGVEFIAMRENIGIATALNRGIERASQLGATHVLLSDQDSVPQGDMVAGLLRATKELLAAGRPVGAVGPCFVNSVTKTPYRFQVRTADSWAYSSGEPTAGQPHLETVSLITSGMLVSCKVLEHVGAMRDDFFIDYVDVEWCHRARWFGYELYATNFASMSHHMGEESLEVWVFGWRSINAYGPLRLYYRFRNFFYMYRLRHVPWWWKLRASWYWLGEAYAHLLFSKQRGAALRMILRGCRHGLLGRMGPHVEPRKR